MHSDKELYRHLRALTPRQLWEQEVPSFDRAHPRERSQRVSLIRAVGVAFSTQGTPGEREVVRAWLRDLLKDPDEKVRRYAINAFPKIGIDSVIEGELLELFRATTVERERVSLAQALSKIASEESLRVLAKSNQLSQSTGQKVSAHLARRIDPSSHRMDVDLASFAGVQIHLHSRRGLEGFVRDEVAERITLHGTFRIGGVRAGLTVLRPIAPFSLNDLFAHRCFATAGFVLATLTSSNPAEDTEAIAAAMASPVAFEILRAFTEGSLRYRLEFLGKGHQRGAVAEVIQRAYALRPEILNDSHSAPWAVEIHDTPRGRTVELRPRFPRDPRFAYRLDDVAAASHPPLAAAMARAAGRFSEEIVWDPFCGSGLELIECALSGGVRRVIGTDIREEAIMIARANVAAARQSGLDGSFTACDFRHFSAVPALRPGSVSLVITNPPMGRRVRVPNLPKLLRDFFTITATVLKEGGRLVWVNPLKMEPANAQLKLRLRRTIDMGGFDGVLEMYEKVGPLARAVSRYDRGSGKVFAA